MEPINDPPFINVPSYVFLDQRVDEEVIFDMQKHKFEAFIGDPDVLNFPGMNRKMRNPQNLDENFIL